MDASYDRTVEDLGNVVALEHVNVQVPDQRIATLFYIAGLGLTRDPYIMTGVENMWINAGRSQFHLPTGAPQVLRGRVGLVMPDRNELLRRLDAVRAALVETRFAVREEADYIEAVSPWGNVIRCHVPDEKRFGRLRLAMPYVEFDVPPGSAEGIAKFYRTILATPVMVSADRGAKCARVAVGLGQELVFRESGKPLPEYDGHHIQIYLANFSAPYIALRERGLVTEESDQHQYRFKDIVDLDSGKLLFTIEHEMRSMRHPLYARPLVNRNPAQTNRDYAPGHDAAAWGMPHS